MNVQNHMETIQTMRVRVAHGKRTKRGNESKFIIPCYAIREIERGGCDGGGAGRSDPLGAANFPRRGGIVHVEFLYRSRTDGRFSQRFENCLLASSHSHEMDFVRGTWVQLQELVNAIGRHFLAMVRYEPIGQRLQLENRHFRLRFLYTSAHDSRCLNGK